MSGYSAAAAWVPPPELSSGCRLARYMSWLEASRGRRFASYDDLWRWSVEDLEGFWASIWEYFEVVHGRPYGRVLGRREMPGARWFPDAELSYAENLLTGPPDDKTAILHASESRTLAEISWGELREDVAAVAAGLRRLGVQPGDRVVSLLPNIAEAVVAFLGVASLGAVWSSCSPDTGANTVIDRFRQIEPKVLVCADGYRYGGREFDQQKLIERIRNELPSLRAIVVVPYVRGEPDVAMPDAVPWDRLRAQEAGAKLSFERLPFNAPLWILYSSGTTGPSKAMVQSQGGILLEHLKTHHLHLDLGPEDRFFWFSTTGWMMWNFVVSGLLVGAQIVLYDGSPGYPDLSVLWDLAARARITVFGTSAAFIGSCMKASIRPAADRDLSALRALGSTGSPLEPAGFDWVYRELGEDTWLFSMSGGTDVCSAFIGGVPLLPVYRGELQCRALGAAVQSYDDQGRPLIGKVGELVLTEPMPSMPTFFWGDADGSRYRDSYFTVYPGVWRHGDWVELTERGTGIIHGRSDSTINRSGIRIGTSEIYRAVLDLPDVLDALAVDVPRHDTDGYVFLFVVVRGGSVLDDRLRREIAARIRADCSPRHVPDEIRQIREVPRTANGKILEVPVKRILMGVPVDVAVNRDAVANPAALDVFVEMADALGGA